MKKDMTLYKKSMEDMERAAANLHALAVQCLKSEFNTGEAATLLYGIADSILSVRADMENVSADLEGALEGKAIRTMTARRYQARPLKFIPSPTRRIVNKNRRLARINREIEKDIKRLKA